LATDSTSRNESLTEVIPKALGQYLLANVEGLKEFYAEFPAAHRQFLTPSVSIIVSSDEFRPLAHKESQTPTFAPAPPTPDGVNQVEQRVNWVIGIQDYTLQVDVWARNKEERDDLVDSVFNALNPDVRVSGLRLELDEYFDQICDYLYISRRNNDGAERAQEDEWRSTMELLATCKTVQTRKEFVIEKTDLDVQTFDTVEDFN